MRNLNLSFETLQRGFLYLVWPAALSLNNLKHTKQKHDSEQAGPF